MNLFVCYTHLQLVIASRIIAHRNLLPDDVEIFYISKIDNDVTKNTLQDMREICGKVTFIHMKLKYPLYFPAIFRHFFKRRYDAVFVASIDNVLIHFILSRVSFNHLFTFDDGSANIIPGSIYYQSQKVGVIGKVCRAVLMIQLDMESIKKSSQCHYTIYGSHKNIIPRTMSINMFSSGDKDFAEAEANTKISACNVILGSVYSDIFCSGVDIIYSLDKCCQVVKDTDRETFYLPHPREIKYSPPSYLKVIKARFIAEREVSELLKKYQYVHVYGFLSSCQINLIGNENIINHVFYLKNLSPIFKEAISGSIALKNMNVIHID
ncbi:glycosyltransferase family 52 protein [Aeromonas veronii]